MERSILNRMTIEAQATNLRCNRGLLRLIEMNRARPAVLERACQKIVRRPPPGLNGSDLVMTEEGLQTSWSALEPCGDWGRAIISLCKGQEAGVDIIRGGQPIKGIVRVKWSLSLQCSQGPTTPLTAW
jgi:hypothetical protein